MTAPLLVAENLTMAFGGVVAVDRVSFEVFPGEVMSLIGPNGAGKSTVFNLVSRLHDPTNGRILFDNQDITRMPPHAIPALGIARTFQNMELFDHASVLDNLLLGRHVHRRTRWWQEVLFTPAVRKAERAHREQVELVIDLLDLQAVREMPVGGLAYGIRKTVELGRALCLEPRLLLLDEPSSGLNPEETDDLSHHLDDIKHDLGITVLMVEHHMGLVRQVSDRVVALNSGQVLATGTAREVQSHPDVVRAYLGVDAAVEVAR